MAEDLLKKRLMARNEFIEFKNFLLKKGNRNSAKRIKLNSIEEYYVNKEGVIVVFHSGRQSNFRFDSESKTNELMDKLDSLFNIERI